MRFEKHGEEQCVPFMSYGCLKHESLPHPFYHRTEQRYNPQASDTMLQEEFLSVCGDITDVPFAQ